VTINWKGVAMTALGHIAALQRRHQELEAQLELELQHRSADQLLMSELKRKKLEIKDELSRMQRSEAA
jgi:hypothetical protein